MATKVVAGNIANATQPALGNVFEGKTFWLSQSTPSRSRYVNDIVSNGGTRTELEDLADYKIADHVKSKHAPLGSVSYQFIDQCMRQGALVDHKPHLIFPETLDSRPIGSVQRPSKLRRTAFTTEDDHILAKWTRESNDALHGNLMFQKLEVNYPHHTWQSWRDRYVKGRYAKAAASPMPSSDLVEGQSGTVAESAPAPLTTPDASQTPVQEREMSPQSKNVIDNESADQSEQRPGRSTQRGSHPVANGQDDSEESVTIKVEHPFTGVSNLEEDEEIDEEVGQQAEAQEQESEVKSEMLSQEKDEEGNCSSDEREDESEDELSSPAPFSDEDFQTLLHGSKSILSMEPDRVSEAWDMYAEDDSLERTGEQWREFWETKVRPVYEQQREQRRLAGAPSPGSVATDTEEETSYDEEEADSRASPDRSGPGTPQPTETKGIEILADDGKRHLSTPIRTKYSQAEKRKQNNERHDSDSTPPIGERSPLKRRRLDTERPRAESSIVAGDSEVEDDTTQAQGAFHTAPTGDMSSHVDHIDLSQLTDGHESSGSDSSAAFEDSQRFETARTARRVVEAEGDSSEGDDEEGLADTQGHIDAQLLSEMSSAAHQASPPASQRRKRTSPSPRDGASVAKISREAENSIFLEDETSEDEPSESVSASDSGSDTDLDAVVVTRRTPVREFAPAAFQSSPQNSTPRPPHTLLPPFSTEPLSAKARGKQRRPPSPRAAEMGAATQEVVDELSANDLPTWLHAQLGRGVPMQQIQTAVKAASGDLDAAERVLLALEQGDGVPTTTRGIWTSEDDAALRADHETRLIPLVKKHGRKLIEERREFLRAFEGDEEE